MSIRDLLLNASQLDGKILIVSEMKGNPARIEIQNSNGITLISLEITVSIIPSTGRIKRDKMRIRCENKEWSEKLISILGILPEDNQSNKLHKKTSNSNLLWIKKGEKGIKAVIEFFDENGQEISPRIYVHRCRI